jgi:hypothetical protein
MLCQLDEMVHKQLKTFSILSINMYFGQLFFSQTYRCIQRFSGGYFKPLTRENDK